MHTPRETSSPGASIVFGIHPVEELIETRPHAIERIYFEQERSSQPLFELLKKCRKLRLTYQVVPPRRIDELGKGMLHQGVLALCAAKEYLSFEKLSERITATSDILLLLPASIEDPRNLGAIARSAVAFGVHAMLLEGANSAPLGDIASKTSAGALEHLDVCRPRNLEAAVGTFRRAGVRTVGLEAQAPLALHEATLTGPLLIIMGGENRGVPPYLRKQCDQLVSIPMNPVLNSLNVSAAATVALYEAQRQRSQKP